MNDGEAARWQRLGQIVRLRRVELHLSQKAVQDLGGPSDVVQSRIENDDASAPRPRGSTLNKLDGPLQWEPGSAIAVLNGGEPTAIRPPDRGPDGGVALRDASNDDLIDELRRRLADARRRNLTDDGQGWAPGWAAGDDPQPSSVRRYQHR
ncbi:hypothetical protein ACAG26_24130 [Mycobacterium sp. pUA109]|uniref:hypothetical protein n=1 Tax=Mycobacterium sp. pUA109 TaxID=3238982 RepID=UPI00351B8C13